jgi:hypothetical protein
MFLFGSHMSDSIQAEQSAPPAEADPEIEALLDFTPVQRKCVRHDGWPPEIQRGFVAALVETGSPWRAAQRVRRTESGAYKVRTSAGAEEFAAAWDAALALYHRRNPKPVRTGRPSRGERLAMTTAAPGPVFDDPEAEQAFKEEVFGSILRKYALKLVAEREARLDGRIVEADFLVRQLTYIEVMLDLGSQGMAAHDLIQVFGSLTPPDMATVNASATPMSLFLDSCRRDIWREKGEPDRPAPAPLGQTRDGIATGERTAYMPSLDGDRSRWTEARARDQEIAAEAQRLWEEKARAEAEAWAERVEAAGAVPNR